ncbi:MAG: glycosyltransferase family 4 protein [Persicimonas sp.]
MTHANHILMTTDTIGGVWTYAMELVGGLCARGVDVTLAAMGEEPSERQAAEAGAIDGLELEARAYRLEWMQDPWDDLGEAAEWLSALARRRRPDIVHLNTLAHGALDWPAPVLTVGHSCVLSWFESVKDQPAGPEWERYREVVGRSLKASDMVVAPSATMLQALQRHYGPFEQTRVIYNGRSPQMFPPGNKQPVVLTAGRLWDEAKNVRAVVEASRQIDWEVAVAGSTTHPDGGSVELDGVRALGRLEQHELVEWYARSSIYVLPARYEPFGLTALEAALAGNALVLGDIATLREIWGDCALFVDPDDSDRLAEVLEELINDAPRRRWLADRARQRALHLGASAMVDRYMELYREMRADRVWPERSSRLGGRVRR